MTDPPEKFRAQLAQLDPPLRLDVVEQRPDAALAVEYDLTRSGGDAHADALTAVVAAYFDLVVGTGSDAMRPPPELAVTARGPSATVDYRVEAAWVSEAEDMAALVDRVLEENEGIGRGGR